MIEIRPKKSFRHENSFVSMIWNCLTYKRAVKTIGLVLVQFLLSETVYGQSKPLLNTAENVSFYGVLHYLSDGDSFVVKNNNTNVTIRLWGIDAPEYDQPHSKASKDALEQLLSKKRLRIIPKDIDKYGRTVAIVEVENIIVNSMLVAKGNAWVHTYYCLEPVCDLWYELEEKARSAKSGLWSGGKAIEPWVWKMKK